MIYGLETWTIKKSAADLLDRFERKVRHPNVIQERNMTLEVNWKIVLSYNSLALSPIYDIAAEVNRFRGWRTAG